jgi:hypothetical protein
MKRWPKRLYLAWSIYGYEVGTSVKALDPYAAEQGVRIYQLVTPRKRKPTRKK